MNTNNNANVFEITSHDGYKIIKLNNVLEIDSAKKFSESVAHILTPPPADIVLSLENVPDVSNNWLRALMNLQQALNAANKQLRLIHVSNNIAKQLQCEGISSSLKHHPNLRAALVDLKLVGPVNLDVNLINPFIAAAIKVCETQASTKATTGKIYTKSAMEKFTGDIFGVISLVCDAFTGSMIICFPEKTFLMLMSRMLGEEYIKIDHTIQDGAGEMTNMIFGQAKVMLNEKGYGMQLALPTVVIGSGHDSLKAMNTPRMIIPFQTDAGEFVIEICILF